MRVVVSLLLSLKLIPLLNGESSKTLLLSFSKNFKLSWKLEYFISSPSELIITDDFNIHAESIMMHTPRLSLTFYMVFHNVLFLAHSIVFILYTTRLSTASSLVLLSTINSMTTTTLSSFYHFLLLLSHKTLNFYKKQSLKYHLGWLLTFFLSTLLKPNFYNLVFLVNVQKLKILLYLCLQISILNQFLLHEI